MPDGSTTTPPDAGGKRGIPRRHRYSPNTACQSHLVLYGGPALCPNARMNGLKVCAKCAAHIAESVRPTAKPPTESQRRIQDVYRLEAESLRDEVDRLRREVAQLTDMSPSERRRHARGTPTEGTVYALLSGYNVKIGWTGRDLAERLREYPPNSTVLVAYPGARGEEARLKRRFAHHRTHGEEWFTVAPQITEWVDQMIREHGKPSPDITCGPSKYEPPRPHAQKPTLRPKSTRWHVS